MALLTITVLVGPTRLNGLSLQAVVPQQTLVAFGERRPGRSRGHRCGQPIRAVQLRHATQLPQRVLEPFAQALVALREAHRARLPVGVGQHEMVDQMGERHPLDGHPQAVAVREVAGTQPSRYMYLVEEHLLRRARQRPPLFDPSLQRPQLAVGEPTGAAALQIHEQRLRLQAGVAPEHLFELRPDLGKRIRFGTPVSVHEPHLTGQPA